MIKIQSEKVQTWMSWILKMLSGKHLWHLILKYIWLSGRGFDIQEELLERVVQRDVSKSFNKYLSSLQPVSDVKILAIVLMAHGSFDDRFETKFEYVNYFLVFSSLTEAN